MHDRKIQIIRMSITVSADLQSVWPDKNRQMFMKVAQIWFH